MISIPPKPRNEVDLKFYTLGEALKIPSPAPFTKHAAEPGQAASILKRNPRDPTEIDIKPKPLRGSSLTEKFNPGITSLASVRQVHNREYAVNVAGPFANPAKTVRSGEFSARSGENTSIPVTEDWVYMTRPKPATVKGQDSFKVSEPTPDWFKVSNDTISKQNDPTLTLVSKITGWIYVNSESRNRKHRLGKHGPFNENQKHDMQNVSNLAPSWMQREVGSLPPSNLRNVKPPPFLRQEQKRMILAEEGPAQKSIYSYGDFRHDIRTKDEVQKYNLTVANTPKQFFEWKEDIKRQKFDKPVTEKVGAAKTYY